MELKSCRDRMNRRDILQILAALGFTGTAAAALAAEAAPVVSDESIRGAAALLSGSFGGDRLAVAKTALQRNLDQFQVVRDLELPDSVEPAVVFQPRRSS
jgi:hypothetical protein